MEKKRIFIAIKIDPSEQLAKAINSLKNGLEGERIRWVRIENIHITLAFLGDMNSGQVDSISEILASVTNDFESFTIRITGAGVFKNLSNPRVIWFGLKYPETFLDLRKNICMVLEKENLFRDQNKFSPHITVGRLNSISEPEKLGNVIGNLQDKEIYTQSIGEVVLFESVLKPDGPVYQAIEEFSFGGEKPNT